MTAPRMCLPGTTYLVTRSCAERRFLLRPDPVINELFAYCLARALRGLDIEVHAVMVVSNHYHAVVTDRSGDDLSAFMHSLNRLVACCLKEYFGRTRPEHYFERVWARRSFSAVALLGENAVRNALAYTLTNPVKDGLVSDYRRWPGFHTKPRHWLQAVRSCERPRVFFADSDDSLERLPLRLTPPPLLLLGSDPETVTREIEDVVLSEQGRHMGERSAEGKRTLGVKGVLGVDPFDSPVTPRLSEPLNPQLACGGDYDRMREAKGLLRAFRAAYREAFRMLRQGQPSVFPFGTLLHRLRLGVGVAEAFVAPWCVPRGMA